MKSIRGSYKKYLGYIAFTCLLAILPLRTGVANAASVQACGQWNVVPSPNSGSSTNHLFGVKVLSSTDVWAVGNMQNNGGGFQTLIEHWDGTQWSVAAQPVTGGLQAVAAISASDIWAVGTVIEHYDGTSWSVFPSSVSGALNGVVAISSNDVWAVGFYNGGGTNFTLIEHWNGTQWSIVPGPKLRTGNANLFSVTALSAQDAWAVGYAGKRALIEHWNGKVWKNTKQKFDGTINAIAAVSATNIWAVEYSTTMLHWDGSQWSFVTMPPPPPNVVYRAFGIAVASANDIWMVGDSAHEQNPSYQTLTEFYC